MGLFDNLKSMAKAEINRAANQAVKGAVNGAVNTVKGAVGKGSNREVKFTFNSLPTSVAELKALPECKMDTAFKTTALTIAVLANFDKDKETTYEMLNVLKGPEPLSNMEKQQITERLTDKMYKVFAFFKGATVDNDYKPTTPYEISIFENPYSFDNENWATMWVKSAGADDVRSVKLRKKPSTGEWFLNDIQCLGDIRIPKSTDKWA